MVFIVDIPDVPWDDHQTRRDKFLKYQLYLESIREKLPSGARSYSEQHLSLGREAPHDGLLEEVRILPLGSTGYPVPTTINYPVTSTIIIRLFGSYYDGHIEFHYKNVHSYTISTAYGWSTDEVRLSPDNRVIHEIRFDIEPNWKIQCEDFTYTWIPLHQ